MMPTVANLPTTLGNELNDVVIVDVVRLADGSGKPGVGRAWGGGMANATIVERL